MLWREHFKGSPELAESQALHKCDPCLSALKTVINPKTTTNLGWVWKSGTSQASSHHFATFTSCPEPDTVGHMRSFIETFKVLACVIPGCSLLLSPCDDNIVGRKSKKTIQWMDNPHTTFHNNQQALATACTITLPKPDDQLWIVTDSAICKPGIGAATLYATCDGKLCIIGFFSAKLTVSVATPLIWGLPIAYFFIYLSTIS